LSYGRLILDTNLLLLLIVGSASKDYISKHKRLKAYSEKDFDILMKIISYVPNVFVTPNILTETSNLAGQIPEPARTKIFNVFRDYIPSVEEHYCESRRATNREEFIRLGLTDAVILHEMTDAFILLTDDFDLYSAAIKEGYPAQNFNHLRDTYL
jgi:hypothetical protein